MKIKELLVKDNNNLDIFRLIAAFMVIYGHAFAIAPQAGKFDLISLWIGFGYSGSLAVIIFFFISGLVVANSLMEKKSVIHFLISRVFRIFPALILVVLGSGFFIGPLVTNLGVSEYLSNHLLYKYIVGNILLDTSYALPGVFENNKYPSVVNGSLWTLPYEMAAYLGLVAIFMLGGFRSKIFSIAIFLIFFADPFLDGKLIFTWQTQNAEVDFLIPSFALGVIVAIFKDELEVDGRFVIGLLLIYFLFRKASYAFVLLHLSIFAFVLWLSAKNWMKKLKPKIDLSYGVYLWGFPVQQVFAHYIPNSGIFLNQILSIVVALVCAWISWHLVEEKSIAMGKVLIKKMD